MRRLLDVPKEKKARLALLREHVMDVVREITEKRRQEGKAKSKLGDVRRALMKRGWKASDFKGRWGSDDFERAVDRALQYQRKASRITYHPVDGWVPVIGAY
jgi:Ni,Fe-hydrogenase III large subunit